MVLIIETIVEVLKACVSPVALFILALMILIVYIFKAGTNYLNITKIIYRYFLMQENTCGYSGECLYFYPPHWCRSLRSQVN